MRYSRKFGVWGGVLLGLSLVSCALSAAVAQPWETIEWRVIEGDGNFYRTALQGQEVALRRGDARRRVPSYDQGDFPEPESGCGPTAALNWLLWMENLGCFGAPALRVDDATHVKETFALIDEQIRNMRQDLSERRVGSNRAQIAATMDHLAGELSEGKVRMAVRSFKTPLKIVDLLGFVKSQRAGILIGQVVEDGPGSELGELHALNLVAVDRRGGLMLNNWGERGYGYLRTYPDGQYFFPENTEQAGLKIVEAMCLIPIRVTLDTDGEERTSQPSKVY
tara:strand:+ start:100272 stop:101111 length:840 start_codon:yes stop_codon:yes gene_type:complete